jgi:chemotaxis signal transduction protein
MAETKPKWLRPAQALNRPFIQPARDEEITEGEEIQLIRRLGFRIGEIGLLITPGTISELTDMLRICPVPNTAGWMLGLVNIRGNLIPVFEMASLLGIQRDADKKRMLLILGQGDMAAGIPIDGLPAHQTLASTDKLQNLPALPDIIRPYISVGYEKNGELWFQFDHIPFFQALSGRIAL